MTPRDPATVLGSLQALMPSGWAWSRRPDGVATRLLATPAAEVAMLEAAMLRLLEEATDPRLADALLPEWEAAYGLPDPCLPLTAGLNERRAALIARVTGGGGQSRAFFIALAASFGVAITITEFSVARAGMRAGDRCTGTAWATAWRVDAPAIQALRARAGSPAGVRLQETGSATLECLFARQKPAQTFLFFAYGA